MADLQHPDDDMIDFILQILGRKPVHTYTAREWLSGSWEVVIDGKEAAGRFFGTEKEAMNYIKELDKL